MVGSVLVLVTISILFLCLYGTFGSLLKISKYSNSDFQAIGSKKSRWIASILVGWLFGIGWIIGWIFIFVPNQKLKVLGMDQVENQKTTSAQLGSTKKKSKSKGWDLTTNFDFLNQLPLPDGSHLPVSQSQWLEDPTGDYDERFWDGIKWTRLVRQKNGSELWQIQRQAKANEIGLPIQPPQTKRGGEGNQNEQKIRQADSQNIVADLKELTGLFDRGAITIGEFKAAKERMLGTGSANE